MTAAAAFVLAMVALGLARILYGPAKADRMMGVQLFGSGGIAALLLWGVVTETPGVSDLALVLARRVRLDRLRNQGVAHGGDRA